MSAKIDKYVDLYKNISYLPSVVSATILPKNNEEFLNIHSTWSFHDLVKLEKIKFGRDYVVNSQKLKVLSSGMPYETSSYIHHSVSDSGRKQAFVREKKSSKNSDESFELDVWSNFKKEHSFELSDKVDHAKINSNAFASFSWSPDESCVLYTAEAKQPKSTSFFKTTFTDEEAKCEQSKGFEYVYREEWGEDFVGSHHSVAVVFDLRAGKAEIISADEHSVGEAIWGPNNETVFFVGYKEFPRRLGIRSCKNRSSSIFMYNRQTKEIKHICGGDSLCVCNLRLSYNLEYLYYLEYKVGGPHNKGAKLKKYALKDSDNTTVIDLVDSPTIDEFPGLYVISVPSKCWYKNYLFLTCQWRSLQSIVSVNTEDSTVNLIEPKVISHPEGGEETFGTCVVLSVYKNFILAEFSSPNIEPCLVIGSISEGDKLSVNWKYLDSKAPVKHSDIEWKVVPMNSDKPELYYEAILIAPTKKQDVTSAIIRGHGGPHVAYSPSFSKNFVAFTKLNYVNILVNYRGSTGFGENSLNSLPGNVGKQDVEEVQAAAVWLKNQTDFNIKNCFVIGGSHGGFLSAHLIGQYPDFYNAAVLLNPVVDIAGMCETTDIPDWNWVEGGLGNKYDPSVAINPDQLKQMWERSPMRYCDNIRTPVLLLLGNQDLRVPYPQGLKFYRVLKAKKATVSLFVYEDNHSIGKTKHDADAFMQTAIWLDKYSS